MTTFEVCQRDLGSSEEHFFLQWWVSKQRSLAIAHDAEDDFWEEIEVPVIRRGKDTGETKYEWQSRQLSKTQLQDLIRQIIETGPSSR